MKLKVFIQVFSLILAINFAGEVIFIPTAMNLTQMEIDFDSDSESKESKDEKESDKINQGQKDSGFGNSTARDLLAIHYATCWTSPTIEMNFPPPEVG